MVTPWEDGCYTGEVLLTYEDASQKEVAVTVPLEFTSTMAYVEDDWSFYDYEEYYEEPEPEAGLPWPLIAGIAGGGVLITVIVILILRKKRKASRAAQADLDDWFAASAS